MQNRSEAPAMYRTGPVLPEEAEVIGGPVAFMLGKIVVGVPPMILNHQTVSSHLGDDRSSRDGAGQAIAFDDGALRNQEPGKRHRIQQQKVRLERECLQGAPHRQPGCLKDIQPIDLRRGRRSNTDTDGSPNDFGEQPNTV